MRLLGGLSYVQMQICTPTLDVRHLVDKSDGENWGAGQHWEKVNIVNLGQHNTSNIEVKQSRDDKQKMFRGGKNREVPLCRPFSSDNFHIFVYAPHFWAIWGPSH